MSGWLSRSGTAALLCIVSSLAMADEPPQTDIGRVSTGAQNANDQQVVQPSPTRTLADAIAEQKAAPNIINVQPLEEMIKLPDVNLAEALQRMPGISVETDTGEGRFVNIRGLDSDLNGTTYGGVRMPPSNPSSPFGGARATAFDVIPTGLVGGIELTKTNRPDIDAEALGGTINLVPRSGDAHGGTPFTEIQIGGGDETLRGTPVYDFGITSGRSFSGFDSGLFSGPKAFSALITAIYHQDKRGIDDVEEAYSDQQSVGVPDKLLSELDLRRYDYKRETYGFAGNLDAKADELNSFYLRLLWSGYLEHKINHHLDITGLDSGCVSPESGMGNLDCSAAAGSPSHPASFSSPATEFDQDHTDSSERIDNQLAVLGGKSIIGGVELDYHTSIAQGRDVVNYSYKSDFVNPNNVAVIYDNNSNPNYPNYQTTDGTDATNPNNYELDNIKYTSSTARDREWGGGLDATIDAAILDLGLPNRDGLQVLAELRSHGNSLPIVVLTARNSVAERIKGLDAGADDYMCKPFDFDELVARLRAVLRRRSGQALPILAYRDLTLNPTTRRVSYKGDLMNLSAKEFSLLEILLQRPGIVVTPAQLRDKLYGWEKDVESNTVEVYIHALRRKLGHEYIENVRSVGYRMPLP